MTTDSSGSSLSPKNGHEQNQLADEYRRAAAARAEEITSLLQKIDVLTAEVDALREELVDLNAAPFLTSADEADPARELRRLRSLEKRRSVQMILRLDSLIGRRDGAKTQRSNAVR